ncbi:MAG TPA: hypothetical protein VEK08_00420 [Planctomycetota bacterium]|nr:hypothetical protein [Planctomycetota bacterium]
MPHAAKVHRSSGQRTKQQARAAYEVKRDADPLLSMAKEIRGSTRYKRFRQWFKQAHPLCVDPFGHHQASGIVTPAEECHHIVPLIVRPDLACDECNCAALCIACHRKVEAMVKAGERTEHLFHR